MDSIEEARKRMIAKRFGGNAAGASAGGDGSARRNKKTAHKVVSADDKKLTGAFKKLGCQPIPGIEEVNLFKDDGNVIHFSKPIVQAAVQSNTFVVSGNGVVKSVDQLLPGIISQLGQDNMGKLIQAFSKMNPGAAAAAAASVDEAPELVENFEDASER